MKVPKEEWPIKYGHRALDLNQTLSQKCNMKNITDEVETGDLVIFHTMIPHKFTQKCSGIRRDTYVNYDWYLNGQFQGTNTTTRYIITFY
jgi:hypothetical protein